ncbi:hypothetical protein ADN01_10760 [Levilinea saccharolytica]|uniref:N-formylglutamate amidohydrolase n=2 Tax=Levilinea saccharolytica TaxID=229921 RepID=A0A0M9U304_9CHLR|nr:hypothetical protein ADN01_10760 [Levilinea saccharolytica]GAP19256.1 N-formylglutamate amidohydrolase [Levilinea saccharolytica]
MVYNEIMTRDWYSHLMVLENDVRVDQAAAPGEAEIGYQPGRLPVLLSAPHAARHIRAGQLKHGEPMTAGLARWVAEETGAHVLYLRRRTNGDPNSDFYSPYKQALRAAHTQTPFCFMVDVHGASDRHNFGLALGSMGGQSCARLLPEILAALAEQGFSPRGRGLLRVDLDEKFKGLGSPVRETLTRFAWHELHLPCLQVEIHAQLRDVQAQSELKRTAAALRALVLAAAAAAADCCSKSHGTTLK